MSKRTQLIITVVVVAIVFEGFRLVTQSGLTGAAGSTQNDGYAASGGMLILLGGSVAGYLLGRTKQK